MSNNWNKVNSEVNLPKKPAERQRGRPKKGNEHGNENLLEAALASFAEHGFDQTPLRVIATRAGVDVALISYRYGSKYGLWKAVVIFVAEESLQQMEEFLRHAETLPIVERLQFICIKLVACIFQRPAFSKMLLSEIVSNVSPERKELISETLMKPTHDLIISSLRNMGLIRDTDSQPDPGLSLIMTIASIGLISSTGSFATLLTDIGDDQQKLQEHLAKLACRILKSN
jgi:AcrR family transcriptional regulator